MAVICLHYERHQEVMLSNDGVSELLPGCALMDDLLAAAHASKDELAMRQAKLMAAVS